MKTLSSGVLLACLLLTVSQPALAGVEVVRISTPFHAHHLEGVVVDPVGEPISGVTVEDVDETANKVLATVTTDAQGRFAFPHAPSGTSHFLHLRARGFNPLEVIVKVGGLPRPTLHLKMPIAS